MSNRFLRLEVHGEKVSATVGRGGEIKKFENFYNQIDSIPRIISALGEPSVIKNLPSQVRGERSYVLYWQL